MKSFFEELGGTCHQAGDYLLPDPTPPEDISIGIWGPQRRRYLKSHREPIYTALFLRGELCSHLSEIDAQAEVMFVQLAKQLAERKGITEQLKADRQMVGMTDFLLGWHSVQTLGQLWLSSICESKTQQ